MVSSKRSNPRENNFQVHPDLNILIHVKNTQFVRRWLIDSIRYLQDLTFQDHH